LKANLRLSHDFRFEKDDKLVIAFAVRYVLTNPDSTLPLAASDIRHRLENAINQFSIVILISHFFVNS
jgi:hypothetical protein